MKLDPDAPPQVIDLPTVPDPRGSLTFAERDWPLPFRPQRTYWVQGVPQGEKRGNHAHRETHEAIIAAAGGFRVTLRNPQREEIVITLDSPEQALYVPPKWWRLIDRYSEGAVCLVLASLPYDEADYYRDAAAFFSNDP